MSKASSSGVLMDVIVFALIAGVATVGRGSVADDPQPANHNAASVRQAAEDHRLMPPLPVEIIVTGCFSPHRSDGNFVVDASRIQARRETRRPRFKVRRSENMTNAIEPYRVGQGVAKNSVSRESSGSFVRRLATFVTARLCQPEIAWTIPRVVETRHPR